MISTATIIIYLLLNYYHKCKRLYIFNQILFLIKIFPVSRATILVTCNNVLLLLFKIFTFG